MTPLSGIIKSLPNGADGFDVNQPISQTQATAFKNAGKSFCIRYVPRDVNLSRDNLTNGEAQGILNAGLCLAIVQHVAPDGWHPTAGLGISYGSYCAAYCKEIVGLPSGVNVWLDLEGVSKDSAAVDVIAYVKEWAAQVSVAGYLPGLYVGWANGLTPPQIYDLPVKFYWRAYNFDDDIPVRGFSMFQHTQQALNGITFDPNTVQTDKLGGNALFLSLS
jgi:hypothetical protein